MRPWIFCLLASTLLTLPAAGQKPPPLGVDPAPGGPAGKPSFGGPPPRPENGAPGRPQPAPGPTASLPGKPAPLPPGSGPFGGTDGGRRAVSSGTGFVVAPGRLLTNHHVANGCTEMRVRTAAGGAELVATVAASDEQRDLALLTVRGNPGPPLTFRSGPDLRRGEGVVTYGFPLAGLLSSGPTLTTGEISALAGLRDNPRQFQISAPVQPGNSGGPLLDMQGNVVGVVVSKLNAQRIAQSTGDIPQNVNFAVKGQEALDFLRRNGVEPRIAAGGAARSAPEVGEVAHPSTVFLRCMR